MAPLLRVVGQGTSRPRRRARAPAARFAGAYRCSSAPRPPFTAPHQVRGDRKASRPQRGIVLLVPACVSRRSSRSPDASLPRPGPRREGRGGGGAGGGGASLKGFRKGPGGRTPARAWPPQGVGDETEPQPGRGCVREPPQAWGTSRACTTNIGRCGASPGGGAAPVRLRRPASRSPASARAGGSRGPRRRLRPAGKLGQQRAGRSRRTQCQQPPTAKARPGMSKQVTDGEARRARRMSVPRQVRRAVTTPGLRRCALVCQPPRVARRRCLHCMP